ncbi:glycosyltransferase family 52 [Vibrio cyclitrophicus]
MNIKRLVYENTHYSLLLYLLYDKEWANRDYLLYGDRFDTKFIKRFSKHVSTCKFETSSKICFRKSPIKYFFNRITEIIRFRHVEEVYGNANTFHIPFKRIKRNVVEDGHGTKAEIENYFKGIYPNKLKEVIKVRQPIKYRGPNSFIVSKSLVEGYNLNTELEFVDINESWNELCDSSKERLVSIFVGSVELTEKKIDQDSFLLLTQPFDNDGIMTEEVKLLGYEKIVREFKINEKHLFIKPHPRETSNYKKIFPKAKVLDGNVPFEFFNFLNVKFDNIVTITSSAAFHVDKSVNVIFMGTSNHFLWPVNYPDSESVNYEQ